jgi:hypothetical protein
MEAQTENASCEPGIQTCNDRLMLIGLPDFDGKIIRKTPTTPPMVSVYDLIQVMIGDSANPRSYFERMQAVGIVAISQRYKFKGRGQHPTPIVDAKGAVSIMMRLPGKNAALFREHFVNIIVRVLGGDTSIIPEIQEVANAQQTLPESHPMRLFGQHVEATKPPLCSAGYNDRVLGNQVYFGLPGPKLICEAAAGTEGILVKLGTTRAGKEKARFKTHVQEYGDFTIIDSILCQDATVLEERLKHALEIQKRLVSGKAGSKSYQDTELFIVKDQEDYNRIVQMTKNMADEISSSINIDKTKLSLRLAQELTKQKELDNEDRRAKERHERVQLKDKIRLAELQLKLQENATKTIETTTSNTMPASTNADNTNAQEPTANAPVTPNTTNTAHIANTAAPPTVHLPEIEEAHLSSLAITYQRWCDNYREHYRAYLAEHRRIVWKKLFPINRFISAKIRYYKSKDFFNYLDANEADAPRIIEVLQKIMSWHRLDGPVFVKQAMYAAITGSLPGSVPPAVIKEIHEAMATHGFPPLRVAEEEDDA